MYLTETCVSLGVFDTPSRREVTDARIFTFPGRFNSAFFFKHELLKDFKFYWRMEYVLRIPSDGRSAVDRLLVA